MTPEEMSAQRDALLAPGVFVALRAVESTGAASLTRADAEMAVAITNIERRIAGSFGWTPADRLAAL